MLKKRIFWGLGSVLCAAALVVMIVVYSFFTSKHIFNESANHLYEIYNQVNINFTNIVTRNWNILHGWSNYIEDTSNTAPETLKTWINKRRDDWKFTNFYFISEDGRGMLTTHNTADEAVNLYISQEDRERIKTGDVVFEGKRDRFEGEASASPLVDITLFTIPVDKVEGREYSYNGFEYVAIGVTFTRTDMANTLNVTAFDRQGRCYIVDSEGNVIMSSEEVADNKDSHKIDNFLTHLKEAGDTVYSGHSLEEMADIIKNGKHDETLFNIHGVEYYLTYIPITYSAGNALGSPTENEVPLNDWMMLGIVPSSILNESMDEFRAVTMAVMAAIFILLAAAVVVVIAVIYRRNIKENEVKLKSRDGLFDMLTRNTNDIFVLFSPDSFRSEYVSPNIERILGIPSERIAEDARNIIDAAVDKPSRFTTDGLKKLQQGCTWEYDIQLHNGKTGDEYWFKITLYRSVFNNSDSFVMMLSDRTKERSMNTHLEQALDIAKAANSAKSNFLSNMSHDIRTPMNAIIGFATLIAKDAYKPEKVLEYVRKITYSGQHLLGLINDILDMSKIESGKTSLNMVEFSLSVFLEELYSIMNAQAKAKKQSFEIHTKGSLPEMVLGDKLRLNQIMINLISNAIKYTQEGGNISIGVEAMEQNVHKHAHIKFTVKDDGMGMSEDFVKTIFDPFTREETTLTNKIQGTGLGMAITKNIVDLMGGTITVESQLGKGSLFTVELELATVETEEEDEDFWLHHNITRALVVDDEEEICIDIKELMDGTGVEISYALDGYKAVEMVNEACDKKQDYHIVLLDWKMPGLNGIETAKLIRQKVGKDVPILVLTSYDFSEIEEEAKAAGIDFFLAKPFFVSNFRRAVSQLKDSDKVENIVAEEKEKEGISIAGMRILAAEDNEINAEILVDLLEMEDVSCDIAENGKVALEKFENSAPGTYDVILMDVQMPVMNGHEATRAIRASAHEQAKTIPILAMTANAFDDDVKMALDAGMNAHMAKPIDIEKLKETIYKFKK